MSEINGFRCPDIDFSLLQKYCLSITTFAMDCEVFAVQKGWNSEMAKVRVTEILEAKKLQSTGFLLLRPVFPTSF